MKDEYEITGGERGRYLIGRRSTAGAGAAHIEGERTARIVQLLSHQGRMYALRSDGSVALAWIDHNPQTPTVRWSTMLEDQG